MSSATAASSTFCLPANVRVSVSLCPTSSTVQVWTSQVWCSATNPSIVQRSLKTDVHSPGYVRSFAPSINRVEFAEAFHCKPDQPMAIALRNENCQVW